MKLFACHARALYPGKFTTLPRTAPPTRLETRCPCRTHLDNKVKVTLFVVECRGRVRPEDAAAVDKRHDLHVLADGEAEDVGPVGEGEAVPAGQQR